MPEVTTNLETIFFILRCLGTNREATIFVDIFRLEYTVSEIGVCFFSTKQAYPSISIFIGPSQLLHVL